MEHGVVFGRHRFDPTTGRLWSGRHEVRLTPKAAAVLGALVGRAGEPVTREELFASVWGDAVVGDATLTTCIRELREALDDDARRPRFIETRHRRGYRFIASLSPSASQENRVQLPSPAGARAASLVGRSRELKELRASLERAQASDRQIVFVTGEPGIGKTTLVEAFLAETADVDGLRVAHGRCVEHYGAGEAYLPLLEAMTRLCRQPGTQRVVRVLRQCAPTWLAQMPSVIPATELRSLQRQAAAVTPERMLRELTEAVEVMARDITMVLWLEDLHWSDLSTLDWLAYLARRPERARLLVLGSYRSGEPATRGHPLAAIKDELKIHGRCREIVVSLLDDAAVGEYLCRRFPSAGPPSAFVETIHRRTGGNPLFVVSVCDELVRSGTIAIPDDVRRMISLQFDRLTAAERRVLEAASVAGTDFSAAAAAAGADTAVDAAESWCADLARREAFLAPRGADDWPDGTRAGRYGFRHALYREAVYEQIPPGRRAELHRRVGERLEAAQAAGAGEIAAELAMHFEQGRDPVRAIGYLHTAGETAIRLGAAREAVEHLTKALGLLRSQPESADTRQREIALQIALGGPLMAIKGRGAPEVEHAYTRAEDLCRRVGDAPQLFPSLWGLFLFRRSRGEIDAALGLGQRLLTLAQRTGDAGLVLEAHHALWAVRFAQGDLVAARDHAAQGIALYDADRHPSLAATYGNHDAGVCGLSHGAWALELLGEADDASRYSANAIALARTVGHRFSEAHALLYAARLHQLRGGWQTTQRYAEEARALAEAGGFAQLVAWADAMRGWALTQAGHVDAGIAMIEGGITAIRALTSKDFLTYFLGVLAESLARAGQSERAMEVVVEALGVVEASGERFYAAELHRLKGELLRELGHAPGEVSTCFSLAVDLARSQQARVLEHRARASLEKSTS